MHRRNSYSIYGFNDRFISPLIETALHETLAKINDGRLTIPGNNILDLGCGEQPFKESLLAAGLDYYSSDVSQNDRKNVDYIFAIDNIMNDSARPSLQFDFVVCTEVLEHVLNWNQAFSNINSLLKKDGIILITCPFFYQLHEEPYDFWRPTPFALKKFAKSNGFEILDQQKLGTTWDVLGTLLGSFNVTKKSNKLKHLVYFLIVKTIKRLSFKLLWNGKIQSNIGDTDVFYLTNFVLLKKI